MTSKLFDGDTFSPLHWAVARSAMNLAGYSVLVSLPQSPSTLHKAFVLRLLVATCISPDPRDRWPSR